MLPAESHTLHCKSLGGSRSWLPGIRTCPGLRSACQGRKHAWQHRRVRAPPAAAVKPDVSERQSLTQIIFDRVDKLNATEQASGAGGRTTYEAFKAVEEQWSKLKAQPVGDAAGPAPQFVTVSNSSLSDRPQLDAVICGGTLGIFMAVALARSGLRVAVLERGPLRGRSQEWNLSRKELLELVHEGLATREELEACVNIEFNPVRVGFAWQGGKDVWTRDVLNLGVSPARLVALMRAKLEEAGGRVYEDTALEGITCHTNGCSLTVRPPGAASPSQLSARLVLDCMGHFSPVVRQQRWGRKPNGVCMVVGSLASGFPDNTTADVIFTNTPLQPANARFNRAQYFWEAFPAGSGPTDRTTYMFSYLDAAPYRPSLEAMMEDYWQLLPGYQGVQLDDITFKRLLFAYFPTFKDTPLKPGWDRILQIGDASGIQSPLSFGGFGALTRHLGRLRRALVEAVDSDSLDAQSVALIQAYNPGLSSSWMMQKAMSVREGEDPSPDIINQILSENFCAMERLGEPVMKPFLQDVIKFGPMLQSMFAQMRANPAGVPRLIAHVGPAPLAEWLGHMASLGGYTALHHTLAPGLRRLAPQLTPRERYRLNRLLDAWEYGSGEDYKM